MAIFRNTWDWSGLRVGVIPISFTVSSTGTVTTSSGSHGIRTVSIEGPNGLYQVEFGTSGSASGLPNDRYSSVEYLDVAGVVSGALYEHKFVLTQDLANASGSFYMQHFISGTAEAPNVAMHCKGIVAVRLDKVP